MLGVFAEFERNVIRERVLSGMARAKERGTKSGKAIGRPSTPPAVVEAIKATHAAGGSSLRTIGKQFGVSAMTVRRLLRS
jgi:DNA invertase Pin-like site-specific DNA recombinase